MPRNKNQAPRLRSYQSETAPKQPIDILMSDLGALTMAQKGDRVTIVLIPGKLDIMSIRVAIGDLQTFHPHLRCKLENRPDGTIDVIKT